MPGAWQPLLWARRMAKHQFWSHFWEFPPLVNWPQKTLFLVNPQPQPPPQDPNTAGNSAIYAQSLCSLGFGWVQPNGRVFWGCLADLPGFAGVLSVRRSHGKIWQVERVYKSFYQLLPNLSRGFRGTHRAHTMPVQLTGQPETQ